MDDLLPVQDDSEPPDEGELDRQDGDAIDKASRKIISVVERRLEHFQGPVPHPSILEGYENLVPGSADRIISQAERQTDHRIHLEQTVINADVSRSKLGIWLGFILSSLAILGGTVLVALGHDWAGTTIATAAVASLAGVFVYGTRARSKERQAKALTVPPPQPSDQDDD